MTHDLFTEILDKLEARVVRIAVTECARTRSTRSSPSPWTGPSSRSTRGRAMRSRSQSGPGADFAAEAVIEESAIEFEHEDVNEEEVVEEFKKFLDEVKPDDFSTEG